MAVLLLVAGCGGHGGGSGPNPAPVISNLLVRQAVQGSAGAIRLDMASFDADADLFGGTCVVQLVPGGQVNIPITQVAAGGNPASQTNNVFCIFGYRGHGVFVNGQVFLIDRAGHVSNALAFTFVSEQRRGDQGPDGFTGEAEGGLR
jgi:hypothetical protein